MMSHTGKNKGYMDMSSDQEIVSDLLPTGHTPIWIEAPDGTSEFDMIKRVTKIAELVQYKNNVTVLLTKWNFAVTAQCKQLGWKCTFHDLFVGLEDQVVILLNNGELLPEQITRAINMLIIITYGMR